MSLVSWTYCHAKQFQNSINTEKKEMTQMCDCDLRCDFLTRGQAPRGQGACVSRPTVVFPESSVVPGTQWVLHKYVLIGGMTERNDC